MDWYPHSIGDYDADTLHLTAFEDGVYSRLLRWYYREERPLPDDDQSLAAIARVGLSEWMPIAAKIKAFFVPEASRVTRSNVLQHKRCNEVIRTQTKKRRDWKDRKEKQRKNGLHDGVPRASRGTRRPKSVTRDSSVTPVGVSTPEERRGEEVVVRLEETQKVVVNSEQAPAEKSPVALVVSNPEPSSIVSGPKPAEDFDPVRDMPAHLRRAPGLR